MDLSWRGKKVAFLGDSITDAIHVGTTRNYWQDLQDWMGIVPLVYAINGQQWIDIKDQAEKLNNEHPGEVDAIFIFAGTNDFNADIPLGEWWHTEMKMTNHNGTDVRRLHRIANTDCGCVRGRINTAMAYIRDTFPEQQIVLATPLHRGFSQFGPNNIQPDESYANALGLFMDDYAEVIREAGDIWSAPVVDLFATSGLLPQRPAYGIYMHDPVDDRLHPCARGHEKLARIIMGGLSVLPPTFR